MDLMWGLLLILSLLSVGFFSYIIGYNSGWDEAEKHKEHCQFVK